MYQKNLEVVADDYGLSKLNDGKIIDLCLSGSVSAVSFLGNCQYMDSASEALQNLEGISVGIHLNITDGNPVAKPELVPSLVGKNKMFLGGRHYGVALKILTGMISETDLFLEWDSQISRLQSRGINIEFINSHGHLHLSPLAAQVSLKLMEKHGINAIRLLCNNEISMKSFIYSYLSGKLLKRIRASDFDIVYPLQAIGVSNHGHLTKELLTKLLQQKNRYPAELIVHPGDPNDLFHKNWNYNSGIETIALEDNEIKNLIRSVNA